MGQTFKNNKVWHSYLKNKSPIVLRFKGATMPSKHTDDTIVFFEVRGDPHEKYYYIVENEAIGEVIDDAPHGEWLKCVFDGAQSEATLTHEAAGNASNAGGSYPTRSANANRGDFDKSFSTGNIVGDYGMCLDEAVKLVSTRLDVDPVGNIEALPSVQAMAATLYINWSYSKFTRPLSVDMATDDLEGERKSVLEAINALPSKNGKAHDGRALKTTLAKMEDGLEGASGDVLDKYSEWLRIELESQTAGNEELEDELPF